MPDPEAHPDVARVRDRLREAADEVEAAAKRRDVFARMIADALAYGERVSDATLTEYRQLADAAQEARLYWRVAFDAWDEVRQRFSG